MSIGEKPLSELAEKVFSEKYEFIDGPRKLRGQSGKFWTFNAIVKNKKIRANNLFICSPPLPS